MLTPSDLERYINKHGIQGEFIFLDEETPTVEAAAQALGTKTENIGKSVLFVVKNGDPILAISCGTRMIERRVISNLLGVGRKKIRLAPSDIVLQYTGFPVGTVPPFGHPEPLRTLLDPTVLNLEEIYVGGGAHNAMLRIAPQDILKISQPDIIDLHTLSV